MSIKRANGTLFGIGPESEDLTPFEALLTIGESGPVASYRILQLCVLEVVFKWFIRNILTEKIPINTSQKCAIELLPGSLSKIACWVSSHDFLLKLHCNFISIGQKNFCKYFFQRYDFQQILKSDSKRRNNRKIMAKKKRRHSAEYLLRCFCNYDRCNRRQNFDDYLKTSMLNE